MSATITVRVPGSTANLGSGFDCLGVAVSRWVELVVRRAPDGTPVRLERRGALAALQGPADQDLVYRGFARACRAGNVAPPAVVMEAASDIPVGRGLGSSAAAVVAGAAAARALCQLQLPDDALLALCAELEGHPDNVAPSMRGGAVLALTTPAGRLVVTMVEIHPTLELVFAIPDFSLATERARAVLPTSVPQKTAVTAAARSAALVLGLARADRALLEVGLDDVLHVPHRRVLVPGYDAVTQAATQAGAFGATLSGSGSTLVAVAPAERGPAVEAAMTAAWRATGVRVESFRLGHAVGGYEVS